MLGITGGDAVADVEVSAHPFAIERVDEAAHLQRAEEEFVPDVLDGETDAVACGQW